MLLMPVEGTPVNNLGRGALGAVTGYQSALQDQQEAAQREIQNAYNQQMMVYNLTQAETARMRALAEQKKIDADLEAEKAEREQGYNILKAMYNDSGYDIDTLKPIKVSNPSEPVQQGFMPKLGVNQQDPRNLGFSPQVPMQSDMLTIPDNVQVREFKDPLDQVLKELGYNDASIKFLKPSFIADPQKAIERLTKEMAAASKERRSSKKDLPDKVKQYEYAKANGEISIS